MNKFTTIRVKTEDLKKLMTDGVMLFLEEHPVYEDTKITHAKMFERAVNFYCKG